MKKMKKSIFIMALSVLTVSAIFISCTSPSDKVDAAQTKVEDAKLTLDQANIDYLADIELTKIEAAEIIIANEKSIAEFNLRIKEKKTDLKLEYEAKLKELNEQNTDIKRRLDEYKAQGKEDWVVFKVDLYRALEDINKLIISCNY